MMRHLAWTMLLLAVTAAAARGDSITLRGTSIAMPCTIERIEAGRVFFLDQNGTSQHYPLRNVQTLSFDGLEELDEASRLLGDDEYEPALRHLLRALLNAQSDAQRLWVRAKLAQTHDVLGQYIEAAGHVAEIVLIEQHIDWARLEPVGTPNQTSFAAAQEAMRALREAQRRVRNPQLAAMIDEMVRRIRPVHAALAEQYDGPPIEPGSTLSGRFTSDILADDEQGEQVAEPSPDTAPDEQVEPAETEPPDGRDAPGEEREQTGDIRRSNEAIDELLADGRYDEALAACKRVANDPGRRDVAEFLYFNGSALRGVQRDKEAAVMFMRCAILHRGSAHASVSLIETAEIYRDVYRKPATAARLLDEAQREEKGHDRADVLERIMVVRRSLETE